MEADLAAYMRAGRHTLKCTDGFCVFSRTLKPHDTYDE